MSDSYIEQFTRKAGWIIRILYSTESLPLRKTITVLLLLTPATAFAEVSDKLPSLLFVWALGFIAALICFFGAWWRTWLAPIVAVLPLLWFANFLAEIHSADISRHLYAEKGLSYYIQSYLSLSLLILGVIFGRLMNKRSKMQ